ncbi:hypothetical protein OJF2_74410 [Aquisphaera giovannonii]|uniref:Uncharacterized protein n=1 Tax=Aquisphaera giovannonii TaxID=406548 RepID=A0A5B9WFR6_9BACT|nr:hypothetical protein OJF2_74410 [Aquisphaera giovannonii]
MVTEAQVPANRRNATLSTGPGTRRGKAPGTRPVGPECRSSGRAGPGASRADSPRPSVGVAGAVRAEPCRPAATAVAGRRLRLRPGHPVRADRRHEGTWKARRVRASPGPCRPSSSPRGQADHPAWVPAKPFENRCQHSWGQGFVVGSSKQGLATSEPTPRPGRPGRRLGTDARCPHPRPTAGRRLPAGKAGRNLRARRGARRPDRREAAPARLGRGAAWGRPVRPVAGAEAADMRAAGLPGFGGKLLLCMGLWRCVAVRVRGERTHGRRGSRGAGEVRRWRASGGGV